MIDYNSLPLLKSYNELKRKDKIFSAKFGLGEVRSLYGKDEVIVCFVGRTERISIEDSDLRLLPQELLVRKRATSTMMVNGVKMGRRKMVKFMKDNK